jgi:hypothetical protein
MLNFGKVEVLMVIGFKYENKAVSARIFLFDLPVIERFNAGVDFFILYIITIGKTFGCDFNSAFVAAYIGFVLYLLEFNL